MSGKKEGKKDDQIIHYLGNIGKWQGIVITLLLIPGVLFSWQILVLTFLTPDVEYGCVPEVVPPNNVPDNMTYGDWAQIAKDYGGVSEQTSILRDDDEAQITK